MKQKAVRVGLLLLVLAVWGAVIARAFHRSGAPEAKTFAAPDTAKAVVPSVRDSALVVRLERDPFLDRTAPVRTRVRAAPQEGTAKAPPIPAAPLPAWPKLTYKGRMRNGTGEVVAFLQVNGKDEVVKEGAPIDGCLVFSAGTDTLVLRRGSERRAYPRQ